MPPTLPIIHLRFPLANYMCSGFSSWLPWILTHSPPCPMGEHSLCVLLPDCLIKQHDFQLPILHFLRELSVPILLLSTLNASLIPTSSYFTRTCLFQPISQMSSTPLWSFLPWHLKGRLSYCSLGRCGWASRLLDDHLISSASLWRC
jgi:hypothetical protein